jgi:hypothetical protein
MTTPKSRKWKPEKLLPWNAYSIAASKAFDRALPDTAKCLFGSSGQQKLKEIRRVLRG